MPKSYTPPFVQIKFFLLRLGCQQFHGKWKTNIGRKTINTKCNSLNFQYEPHSPTSHTRIKGIHKAAKGFSQHERYRVAMESFHDS
ncbi:unnamed protein product [Prunus armeniaca]|uniref:Uncharacterized protein n=1 Tax=Prunus armeniaca TaxID=36596 RepID=A0A6J5UTY2_PRUAR|nr:unnamed protein product [Prunus armeniaca]